MKPEQWKNIPACVSIAVKEIVKHVIDSDEVLYEYQTKTNERLFRLQDQISNLKEKSKNNYLKFSAELDSRLKSNDDNIQFKFTEFDSNLKGSQNTAEANKMKMKKLQDQINSKFKRVEAIQEIATEKLNMFEKEAKESLIKLENQLIDYSNLKI